MNNLEKAPIKFLVVITNILVFNQGINSKSISLIEDKQVTGSLVYSDSIEDSYYSYDRTNIFIGYFIIDNQSISLISNHIFFNINYSVSNFFNSTESHSTQIGLYNEIGINNLSVYVNFGPELRLFRQFYLIPHAGVGFSVVAGSHRSGIGFLYYLGASGGVIIDITNNMKMLLETGSNLLTKENYNFYIKLGAAFDIF
jgi:hypothetical protein